MLMIPIEKLDIDRPWKIHAMFRAIFMTMFSAMCIGVFMALFHNLGHSDVHSRSGRCQNS